MDNREIDTRELPTDFQEKMKNMLGEEYGAYLACYSEPPNYGLRVNGLKCGPEEFAALNGFELERIPWIENGFYYDRELKPARHPWYYAGLYYLQEPSAMTPASLLPVEPGDRVLDLCAAPGGKSTELAARLKGRGLLFSNDISSSRAKALLKNLELCGAGNICVSSESPERLSLYFEGYFDKILIDAPCSGEGMFRRDGDMVRSYREKGPDYYSRLQYEIVVEGVKMLRPGGMLLYSTCTFDEEENEGTIRRLLREHTSMRLINLEKRDGFEPGIGLTECVRLFPHKIRGEGHFIALLKKEECGEAGRSRARPGMDHDSRQLDAPFSGTGKNSDRELSPVKEFLKMTNINWEPKRFYTVNGMVYYLPEVFLEPGNRLPGKIRYLRTGLLLGELKKDRFEPSQALAMYLKAEEFTDVFDMDSNDGRVLRYLKGETVQLEEQEMRDKNGWCLVCTDGYPLGFARRQGSILKNKYYPGWRWR